MMLIVAILTTAFLIGSFPTGWIAYRIARGSDIREVGSGSTGATNTFRQLGWKWGIFVMVVDFLKGLLPVLAVLYLLPENWIMYELEPLAAGTGVCAVLGHVFPPWINFRGGKGVATGAGFLVAMFPPVLPVGAGIFTLIVVITRKVSLASLSSAFGAPLTYLFFSIIDPENATLPRTLIFCLLPIVVCFTHRKNILRLISGKEQSII